MEKYQYIIRETYDGNIYHDLATLNILLVKVNTYTSRCPAS